MISSNEFYLLIKNESQVFSKTSNMNLIIFHQNNIKTSPYKFTIYTPKLHKKCIYIYIFIVPHNDFPTNTF